MADTGDLRILNVLVVAERQRLAAASSVATIVNRGDRGRRAHRA